jgi:hypothetical protein
LDPPVTWDVNYVEGVRGYITCLNKRGWHGSDLLFKFRLIFAWDLGTHTAHIELKDGDMRHLRKRGSKVV